jgi:hypothetical protein
VLLTHCHDDCVYGFMLALVFVGYVFKACPLAVIGTAFPKHWATVNPCGVLVASGPSMPVSKE